MASHDLAIDALLNNGLRNKHLESVLASNCVMDWFGRTFIGQRKVVTFYQNSNATHEHSMSDVISTEAFEDRPYHLLTREQPLENLKNAPELTGDETWFDCETHTPVNLKEGQKTPQNKTDPTNCPPAPCRAGLSFLTSSDDELDSNDDGDDLDESGIRPMDTSIELLVEEKVPVCKKMKREHKSPPETCSTAESKYSELHYLEASGSVTINRQAMTNDESERRDCKMFVSYRINKDDPSIFQIALIVYKSNSKNPKTRRNLMPEFEEKASEPASSSHTPSTSRSRTGAKERKKTDEKTKGVSTEPNGAKYSKATKRPMISKASLRF